MSKLPDKKSKLIRLAIADLEKCEADPKYEIDMAVWLLPLPMERCAVCLAGAVMMQEFDFLELPSILRGECMFDNRQSFDFLDSLRRYCIGNLEVHVKFENSIPLNDRKLYHEDPERFKKNMLKIADWYEEIGE